MIRVLQQGEMVICLIGSIGGIILSVLFAVTEPSKNNSTLALAVTAAFGLLALLQLVFVIQHVRHLGHLRWLWSALAVSLVLWYVPASANLWLYNASAGTVVYSYAGVLGLASVAIGILREVFSSWLVRA